MHLRHQESRGTDVLIVSLKAAALGLNLCAANHVVLLDLWWNPAVEEQAIDRAHRIGQKRTVHVTRITIAGVRGRLFFPLPARARISSSPPM
jgi:SNF2 family DNA or RNA helicase